MDIATQTEEMIYDYESDNSESSSIDEKEAFLDRFNEEDIEDLHFSIEAGINEYLEENMLKYSSEDFVDKLIQEITEETHAHLSGIGDCDSDDDEDIEEIVETVYHNLCQFLEIPPRSEPDTDLDQDSKHLCDMSIEKIQKLLALEQPAQRSSEWYSYRHNLFTASNIWKIFASEAQYNSIVYEKCKPIDETIISFGITSLTSAAHWGVKYEQVTAEIYKKRNNVELVELGCIQHPKYSFIGASPDGIVSKGNRLGRMLEIKNPVSRKIDGIPSEAYWIQMQVQMEVCDLDECDFVETQIKEYESAESFYTDDIEREEERGVLLLYMSQTEERPIPKYEMMPLIVNLDKETVEIWINNKIQEISSSGQYNFTPIYWYLEVYSCVLVKRNRIWFEAALPKIRDAWDVVLKEREEGYEHRAPKRRIKTMANALFIDVHKLPAEDIE